MSLKILSVDDEIDMAMLIKMKFKKQISSNKYEFLFAHNAFQAISVLEEHPDIHVMLTDINMPEMNGLDLLLKVKEMHIPTLKCIMVSAYGDVDNVELAMQRGACSFTTKPINFLNLENTIDEVFLTG
ncbi:MAG: response regulator [Bacteroidota bacterium]